MANSWYIEVAGRELGPISEGGLRREAATGRLQPQMMVRRSTENEWQKAGEVPGLFATAAEESPEDCRMTKGAENPQPASPGNARPKDGYLATSDIAGDSTNRSEPEALSQPAATKEAALDLSVVAPAVEESTRWQRLARRALAPWSVSLAAHAVLLLVLGLWVIPLVVAGNSDVQVELHSLSDSVLADLPRRLDESVAMSAPSDSSLPASASLTSVSADAPLDRPPPPRLDMSVAAPEMLSMSSDPLRGVRTSDLGTESKMVPPRAASQGGVVEAAGVGGALDGILGDISGRIEDRNLLVVWLLDASISLVDDRRQIAERLEPFYQQIGVRDKKSQTVLTNAVVAFGAQTKELIKPTHFNGRIVRAVNSVPVDETGLENVMTAVEQCVHKYRSRWKDDILIVVWTDESGDDILRLEQTIRLCREQGVVVTVVGPTAVLGSERGSHLYTDRDSGFTFRLPIKRGPDTSLPERLMIPYWHESTFAPWTQGGAVIAQGAQWYGGPHREGLLSGFGPYALTRLALQTGGTFMLLDREADRGPFDFEALQLYLPDYESAEEYLRGTQADPLRRAVSRAVMRTFHESLQQPPVLEFFGIRGPRYPFATLSMYMTPTRFRDQLSEQLGAEERKVAAALRVIEQALGDFAQGEDYEALYNKESSPRWRAWYDLTRGRLLANSVRYSEYLHLCQAVRRPGGLEGETNHLAFHSAAKLISQGSAPRAAEAERLLTRCIEENSETPWAMLAQWELDHPLGLVAEQTAIPMPPPAPAVPVSGGGGGVSLPNL